jgi:hypothetical protein
MHFTLDFKCFYVHNFSLPVSFILMYLFTTVYLSVNSNPYFKLFVVFFIHILFFNKNYLKKHSNPKKKKVKRQVVLRTNTRPFSDLRNPGQLELKLS